MQGKDWCFTIHITSEHLELSEVFDQVSLEPPRFIVAQIEVCPTTKRRHVQGYVQFKSNQRMNAVKRWLRRADAHVEIARGSPEQNQDYCTKDKSRETGGRPWIWGEIKTRRQGQRTDLTDLVAMVRSGATWTDIIEEHPGDYVRYHRGLEAVRGVYSVSVERAVEVELHWGASGAGKTRQAYDAHPELYRWRGGKWFDGYNGQETLLLDDFEGNIPWTRLLNLLDRYPMTVETKGGHVAARWTRVIITSNLEPAEWYPMKIGRALAPLLRRIAKTKHYPETQNWDQWGANSGTG